jgi:queuine/archaeosine tRNA-ribosyltransferase
MSSTQNSHKEFKSLIEGDGLSFDYETEINIQNTNETEIILFDLAQYDGKTNANYP